MSAPGITWNSLTIASGSYVSGSNVFTSPPVHKKQQSRVAVELSWTGGGSGSFAIEGAVRVPTDGVGHPMSNPAVAVNWTDIGASIANAGTQSGDSGTGVRLVNMVGLHVPWIRVKYTSTSGSICLSGSVHLMRE